MNMRDCTLLAGLSLGCFTGGFYAERFIVSPVERQTLRERLEERRKELDKARAERDEAKKKYDELWEQHRRRPFRSTEPMDPKTTVSHLDHDSWECANP